MENNYQSEERRKFLRFEHITPLACKVCKPETISRILQGYTANISQAGLLCRINEAVTKDDILWLAFDRATLMICQELERNCFIYQTGIIGKVVRVENMDGATYDVGVRFITREEHKEFEPYVSEFLFLKRPPPKINN